MRDKSLLEQSQAALNAATLDANVENVQMSISDDGAKYLMANLTNLYNNAELAVLRETVANALDSHIRANQKRPILVNIIQTDRTPRHFAAPLPARIRLTVQDFGVGMSKEEILGIYSQYGASTKRDTNTQVGAFGLGAKSPLSVTTAYKVTSIKDGTKIIATVYKDRDGVGNIRIDNENSTTESNGVTVDLDFENHTNYDLLTAAYTFFKAWKPGSVLLNGQSPYFADSDSNYLRIAFGPKDIIGWLRVRTNRFVDSPFSIYSTAAPTIAMGGISYNFDPAEINRIFEDKEQGTRFTTILQNNILNVPIGAIDLTPPREGIRYSDKTTRGILNAYNEYVEIARSTIQSHIDSISLADAISYYFINKTVIDALWKGEPNDLTWRGKDFREEINLTGVYGVNRMNTRIFYTLVFPKSAGLDKLPMDNSVSALDMLQYGKVKNTFRMVKFAHAADVDDPTFTRNIRDYAKSILNGDATLTVLATNDDVNSNEFINALAPEITLDEIVAGAKAYRSQLARLPKEQRDPEYAVYDFATRQITMMNTSVFEDEELVLAVSKKARLADSDNYRDVVNTFLGRWARTNNNVPEPYSIDKFKDLTRNLLSSVQVTAPNCQYLVFIDGKSVNMLKKFVKGAEDINVHFDRIFREADAEHKNYYAIYSHILGHDLHEKEWGVTGYWRKNYGDHVLNVLRTNAAAIVKADIVDKITDSRFASLVEYFGNLTDQEHASNKTMGWALHKNVESKPYRKYLNIETVAPLMLSSTSNPYHMVAYLNAIQWDMTLDIYDIITNRSL